MDKSKNYLIKDFDIRGTEYSYYDQIPNMRRLNSRKRLEMYNGDETKDVYEKFAENKKIVHGVRIRYVHNSYFSSDEYINYHAYKNDPHLKGYARPFRLDTFDHYVKEVKYL
tara:strand:- start:25 stop:360 length:336 start_codon:yes stop_codon:yes gene_type:complete